MTEFLWTDSDWTFPLIEKTYEEICKIGVDEMGLNPYAAELEIISAEQMLDAYSSIGMPVFYKHWSFGKSFTRNKTMYDHGVQGLAYEIVINSDPCISYLMESNTMTMQCLVMAHAGIGHSHFFRNNSCFRYWTDATSILDYLVFAKDYVARCEEREGKKEVERFLDSCHALMSHGVSRFKKPGRLSAEKEKTRQQDREEFARIRVNDLFDRLLKKADTNKEETFPVEPEENILWFCEKYAPDLREWQREVLRIVRKLSEYFYPQVQTKVMNEGTATYVHYRIMNRLHQKGLMSNGSMYEFIKSHTGVTWQPEFDNPLYNGINPYALGFAMMRDIERICKEPTPEDRQWFPLFAGCGDEMGVLKEGWANYRDESFIRQFLSPKVIRDFKLFRVKDNAKEPELLVTAIHNESGYQKLRESLADQYEQHNHTPQLEIVKVEPKTRTLFINYRPFRKRVLTNVPIMIKHLETLWGYPVVLKDDKGNDLSVTDPG
jgi:stage V sporulation protein R